MKYLNDDVMNYLNTIGFGIMLGSLSIAMTITIWFQDSTYTFLCLPTLIIGYFLLEYKKNQNERKEGKDY